MNALDIPVKKNITVTVPTRGQLVVNVQYENVADFDVFILKDPPSLFVTASGADINDIGPSEKRKPYTLADYERVPPGKSTERSQEISSRFAWLQGTHTYEVSISGNYQDPVDHRIWKAPRIETNFAWTR